MKIPENINNDSHSSLQLWLTRFNLLVKLKLFDLANSEAEAFHQLSRPDVFYEFYPEMYDGRKGSMASFSFRLLLAELPMYTPGQEKVALDNLADVSAICKQVVLHMDQRKDTVDVGAAAFWKRRYARSLQSIINCSLLMRNYGLAHTMMQELEGLAIWTNQELHDLHSTWVRRNYCNDYSSYKYTFLSQCRIYLQCGDIFNADQQHSKSRLLATRYFPMTFTSDFRTVLRSVLLCGYSQRCIFLFAAAIAKRPPEI